MDLASCLWTLSPGLISYVIFNKYCLFSILAGNLRRVDLLLGSNTGDGIVQLGSNLLADPEKYYKELQEEFSTAGPRLMFGRTEWRQEDVNLAFRLRYTVAFFHKHLYIVKFHFIFQVYLHRREHVIQSSGQ